MRGLAIRELSLVPPESRRSSPAGSDSEPYREGGRALCLSRASVTRTTPNVLSSERRKKPTKTRKLPRMRIAADFASLTDALPLDESVRQN